MPEKNQHIRTAIKGLPVYQAPKKIWRQIEKFIDPEPGRAYLEGALKDMERKQKAPDHLWENLQDALEEFKYADPLSNAIQSLPTYTAPIQYQEIYPLKERKLLHHTFSRWFSGIAAGLLILAGVYYFYAGSKEQVTLITTTEQLTTNKDMISLTIDQLSGEDEILKLIESHSIQVSAQYESPKFKGLYAYYLELDDSKKELLTVISVNQDVHLVDYLIRVEKEKTEVGKQLLQMIIG